MHVGALQLGNGLFRRGRGRREAGYRQPKDSCEGIDGRKAHDNIAYDVEGSGWEDATVQQEYGSLDAEDDWEVHGNRGDDGPIQCIETVYVFDNYDDLMSAIAQICEMGHQADADGGEELYNHNVNENCAITRLHEHWHTTARPVKISSNPTGCFVKRLA